MDSGTRNTAYVGGWRTLANDGPMWALNLMSYRSREAAVDRVGLVRYRSLRDLLLMNRDHRMTKGVPHKFGSLDHTEVFPTKPIISGVQVRLTLGLLLVGVALVGLRGLDWWAERGRRQHQSKKETKNVR